MKAIILAAGYGSRLGDVTKNCPKPTIKIGEKTVIERIIERLWIHGIEDIIVNTHYMPALMVSACKNKALYFYESELLGHEGTIEALKPWIKGEGFFVINGDTVSNVSYTEMILASSPNSILTLMDNWRCAGTWLYGKNYIDSLPMQIEPFRPRGLIWHDIGTPERLQIAKKYYEKT